MNRPPLEVADIIRSAGESFLEQSRHWITWQHRKVLLAMLRCRTALLGGHRDRCSDCGHVAISYNSCGNRHCPKCQGNARLRWLAARERELLPTRYVHAVFTLPRELAPLALQNKKVIFNLLFHASAETLLEVARDPRHLGAEIGFFTVLHTWDQRLQFHPHAHCVLAAGGLSPDHTRWISSSRRFFLPIRVLSRVFRSKFVADLKAAFRAGTLQFHGSVLHLAEPRAFAAWLRTLFRHDWVVYAKRPFGGPEHALRYLGAYTHRVAISNHRLVASRRRQRHLPLARLGPWQQEEADDVCPLTSSCGAFCCICSRAASYASATSASSPTAAAPACCPSASNCYAVQPNKLCQQRPPHLSSVRTGVAHSAAEPCSSSNESLRHNCCSALHRRLSGAQHEPLSSIWILSRSSARRGKPCLIPPATASCRRNRCSPRPGRSSFGQPSALYVKNKGTKHRR